MQAFILLPLTANINNITGEAHNRGISTAWKTMLSTVLSLSLFLKSRWAYSKKGNQTISKPRKKPTGTGGLKKAFKNLELSDRRERLGYHIATLNTQLLKYRSWSVTQWERLIPGRLSRESGHEDVGCNFLDGNNEKKTIYSSKHMNGETEQICKPWAWAPAGVSI